jgi:hypothetical protein
MDSLSIEIVLIAIGILANGFFAGSEIALSRTGTPRSFPRRSCA